MKLVRRAMFNSAIIVMYKISFFFNLLKYYEVM